MAKLTIIDYGVGNLASLRNALAALDIEAQISADLDKIRSAEKLILPGVGAFAPAMEKLKTTGLDQILLKKAETGIPILGICLGMQLLFTSSFEQGKWDGLNLIPGSVRRFTNVKKIPHMGWNSVAYTPDSPLFFSVNENPYFYFVHSYFCEPENSENCIAGCEYGLPFCAAVEKENVCGVQFHPEKSQKNGLQILINFAKYF